MRQMNTLNAASDRRSWQLVLVLWGTKYPVDEVNHLIATILSHADPAPERIVLLSDRPRPGLDARADLRDIPAFFLQPAFLGSGCQAKLCLFEAGVLPDDMPAIFVDIDTVVWGNLARLLALLTKPRTVAILQSAVLPFGPVARWLHRVSRGRRYARGNSSVVVFHPAEGHHVASRFRDLVARHGPGGLRPMVADERFLSWANQPNMRAVPGDLIVKLPTEFMLPYRWMNSVGRAALGPLASEPADRRHPARDRGKGRDAAVPARGCRDRGPQATAPDLVGPVPGSGSQPPDRALCGSGPAAPCRAGRSRAAATRGRAGAGSSPRPEHEPERSRQTRHALSGLRGRFRLHRNSRGVTLTGQDCAMLHRRVGCHPRSA
jgi:hypothetical protein